MKTTITYLFILITAACFGQSSISLTKSKIKNDTGEIPISESSKSINGQLSTLNPDRIWYCRAGGAFEPAYSFRYSYSADSFLRGNKYYFKRIISSNEDGSNPTTEGYYREEAGKLYEAYNTSGGENVIIDMTVEVGDMINLDQDEYSNVIVTDIGTIQLNDEVDRKVIYLKCQDGIDPSQTIEWIEGIGVLLSLVPYCALDNFEYNVICLVNGEQEIYTDPNYNSCWYTTSTKDLEKTNLTVSPNPAHEEITIQNLVGNFEYSIFDISGKMVKSSESKSNRITINHLPKGMYVLRIKNLGVQNQLRFIKN